MKIQILFIAPLPGLIIVARDFLSNLALVLVLNFY